MKTNPFAGLMAGFRGARADDDKGNDDEARQARRAEEDERRQEEDARRAEEDDRRQEEDARRAEEDGTSDDDMAKRADDEEQDPEADAGDDADEAEEGMDDKEASAFRRGLAIGRSRENLRASRIFLNAANGGGRVDLAATLAFTTRNSSAAAGRILGSAGAGQSTRSRTLDQRMGNRTDARPGAGGGKPSGKVSLADKLAGAKSKIGRA
ncbi:hypothetical protein [Sphingomonas paucimobilis]|uniref:hypothetical protein n=1 Tax=Sphingomonas paucimobilis TaxID=13689 RepID=UPI00069D5611|nr:hypothetical protein [Sphingomonas paucimobilis]